MKSKIIFSILAVAALILAPAARADNAPYNMMAERVFDGMVFFPLVTNDRVIEVQLGPKDFVGKSGFNLKAGEMVTVLGMSAIVREREIILAREVRTMRAVLIVRDRNGQPMWDANRPVQMDPEFPESGLCEMIMP